MSENCLSCRNRMKLVKFDYSGRGCEHSDYDGYACTAFAFEGEIVHMVGCDEKKCMCEMYAPKGESYERSNQQTGGD